MIKKPELLIPAGNLEKLKIACIYGADAVFLGGYEFGLRSNSDNFSNEDIKQACEFAKKYNTKLYVTTNIYAHEQNFSGFVEFVKHLENCGVTGIIVSDPGYIQLCQEHAPSLEIHISTQQSIANIKAVEFYHQIGAHRVVLARELSADEIKVITNNAPCEIEIFIHGAVCSSYSGRCTLSNHMTSRDSNRGGCCQSCRWDYQLMYKEDEQLIPVQKQYDDIEFNMSVKDMNIINHLPEILELGADSLKVEGRMKTYHYVATVTKVYREAIDSYFRDPQNFHIKNQWIEELNKAESRLSYIGALAGDLSKADQIYQQQYQPTTGFDFVGMVVDNMDGFIKVEQRNLFCVGDELEILRPEGDNIRFKLEQMWDKDQNSIMRANHPLMEVYMQLNFELEPYSIIRKVVQ